MSLYDALEVPRTVAFDGINKAYRRLAVKFHPDRSPDADDDVETKFYNVSRAFDVLSDRARRALFDRYGEDGLKESSYSFDQERAYQLFTSYFGTSNPFDPTLGDAEFLGSDGYVPTQRNQPILPTQKVPLVCTLEELYNGAVKKVAVKRSTNDGKEEENVFSIRVKPGWKEGTQIVFAQQGNAAPDCQAADVVFVVEQAKHDQFERRGADLVISKTITLLEALTGCTVTIPTLDGRELNIPVSEVVSPGYEKVLEKEGMPINGGAKGDLLIQFHVQYPEMVTEEQKVALKKAFGK